MEHPLNWLDENNVEDPGVFKALAGFNRTDAGNAESFKRISEGVRCFIPEKGNWYKFDGTKWIADKSVQQSMIEVLRLRQKIGNSLKGEEKQNLAKWSVSSESAPRIKAALSLAEPTLAVSFTEFDKDPLVLCCANGVVDKMPVCIPQQAWETF